MNFEIFVDKSVKTLFKWPVLYHGEHSRAFHIEMLLLQDQEESVRFSLTVSSIVNRLSQSCVGVMYPPLEET